MESTALMAWMASRACLVPPAFQVRRVRTVPLAWPVLLGRQALLG